MYIFRIQALFTWPVPDALSVSVRDRNRRALTQD